MWSGRAWCWSRQAEPPCWRRLEAPTRLPARVGHGDLKVSNLRFAAGAPVATAVLDLDTMARTTLDVELGDALRSWCNTASEDATVARLDVDLFAAAVGGYLAVAATWITRAEVAALVAGTERVCLELSARFAADALRERYFGWDRAVARARGEHNLLRARGQLDLARRVAERRAELEGCVRAAHSAAT